MRAIAGGAVTSWASARHLDAGRRRVEFRQELPVGPLESMSGLWTVEPLGTGSKVIPEHTLTIADDAPDDVARVDRITRADSLPPG